MSERYYCFAAEKPSVRNATVIKNASFVISAAAFSSSEIASLSTICYGTCLCSSRAELFLPRTAETWGYHQSAALGEGASVLCYIGAQHQLWPRVCPGIFVQLVCLVCLGNGCVWAMDEIPSHAPTHTHTAWAKRARPLTPISCYLAFFFFSL